MLHIFPVYITRAEDEAPLGHVHHADGMYHAVIQPMQHLGRRVHSGPEDFRHASLDVAVAHIEAHHHVPDIDLHPYAHGVQGPTLAQWGDIRVIGATYLHGYILSLPAESERVVLGASLVVLNGQDRICGYVQNTPQGWSIVVCAGHTDFHKTFKTWNGAVARFHAEILRQILGGTMHQQMQLREGFPGFLQRATAFQAYLTQMGQAEPPARDPALAGVVYRTSIFRREDSYCLGALWTEKGIVHAERLNMDRTSSATTPSSLDAAVNWISASPKAPDLDRFPIHGKVYGPVLWSAGDVKVVGVVAHAQDQHGNGDVLRVLDMHNQLIGSLAYRDAWTVVLYPRGQARTESRHDSGAGAVQALLHAVAPHPGPHQGTVPGEVQADVDAFLQKRCVLVEIFKDMTLG